MPASRRWERFEELLEEAQSTRDYDVTLAINQMADFLLSDSGTDIRNQLSVQLVDQVDQLGVDAVTFARNNIGQVGLTLSPVYIIYLIAFNSYQQEMRAPEA